MVLRRSPRVGEWAASEPSAGGQCDEQISRDRFWASHRGAPLRPSSSTASRWQEKSCLRRLRKSFSRNSRVRPQCPRASSRVTGGREGVSGVIIVRTTGRADRPLSRLEDRVRSNHSSIDPGVPCVRKVRINAPRSTAPVFRAARDRRTLTVEGLIPILSAISLFDAPLEARRTASSSRGVRASRPLARAQGRRRTT